MFALWFLLFSSFLFISWAKPLVTPHLGEHLASTDLNFHSIPPPPSFLFPSPRAAVNVDTSASMFSFAVLPLLAYSTLLAVFGFISVRIARWRRKHRPAALTLDDDGVELLPTNTSTLSPEFKDLPVPPPLPSPIPSHARSRSFSNLQHAVAIHDMPERERPKSPIHFGLSSPGSRLKSKQRSHSVGSISSPLSPKRRVHHNNSARRPFISDPESDADTVVPQRHATVSPQSGTLIDLSVPAGPPVSASSPLNPGFHHMAGSTHLWGLNPVSYPYLQASAIPAEELNLIDLHAPVSEKHVLKEAKPVSVSAHNERSVSEAEVPDTISPDLDGYEPDVEGDAGEEAVGLVKDKEIDIGLEWGFESVSSLSMRVSSGLHPQQATSEERDLVDRNSLSSSSPIDLLTTQLHPIPLTASSSLSEEYRWPDLEVTHSLPTVEAEGYLSLSTSSSSSPRSNRHLVELDAGRRPIDVAVVEKTDAEDDGELSVNVDHETLPSISRDDTSLDSDLIRRVYAAEQLELGRYDTREQDNNDRNDAYESNDHGESDEVAEVAMDENEDDGIRSRVYGVSGIQNDGVDALPASVDSLTDIATLPEVMQDWMTPPPSYEKIVALTQHSDSNVEMSGEAEDELEAGPPSEEEQLNITVDDDAENIGYAEGQFPDPDLLPLPELEIPLLPIPISTQSPIFSPTIKEESSSSAATTVSVSPTSQIPTPPASPIQQRRPLPRPLPAWSIRAADAPPLGLATRSPILRSKKSLSHIVLEGTETGIAKETEAESESGVEIQEDSLLPAEGAKVGKEIEEDVPSMTQTPVPSTATLPGGFPVDVDPLSDITEPKEVEKTSVTETGSPDVSEESVAGPSTEPTASSSSFTPTSVSTTITKFAKQRLARSPIDIALAMQLRPGLGIGADPAWMVRFLMAMFGWFVVLISGSAGDGYGRTPYVGIRKSD